MSSDPYPGILALMRTALQTADRQAPPVSEIANPVITLSRDEGSNGDEIATMLAGRLHIECYDYEILDTIAKRTHANPALVSQLDELIYDPRGLWLYGTIVGLDLSQDTFHRHLINVICGLALFGGVIIGRGGHLILANQATLKLRIVGSADVCAARIAERRGIDLKEAQDTAREANEARDRFLQHHFNHSRDDPKTYDIVLNTDRFQSIPAAVDFLEAAIKARQETEKA